MKIFHLVFIFVAIIGMILYFESLWTTGGMSLLGAAVFAELIIVLVASTKHVSDDDG